VLGAAYLIRYPVVRVLGPGYLVYLAAKHLFGRPHRTHAERSLLDRLGAPVFWSVVGGLLTADVAFAIDQVVAVAVTDELLPIVAASLIAIVVLCFSAPYIVRLMDWSPALEKLAYVAVGFVGVELVGVQTVRWAGYPGFDVPKVVSIAVALGLLVVPLLGKLAVDGWRARRVRRPRLPVVLGLSSRRPQQVESQEPRRRFTRIGDSCSPPIGR